MITTLIQAFTNTLLTTQSLSSDDDRSEEAELERRAEEIAMKEVEEKEQQEKEAAHATNLNHDNDDDNDEKEEECDQYKYMLIPTTNTTPIKKRCLAPPTKFQIRALFHLWKYSLTSGDSDDVSKRYAKGAVLNPMAMTINKNNVVGDDDDNDNDNNFESYMPLTNQASIKEYYDEFISMYRPKDCKILRGRVTISSSSKNNNGNNTNNNDIECFHYYAQDNGILEMTTFSSQIVHVRYAFVYVRDPKGRWKIMNNTLSKIPTTTTTNATTITGVDVVATSSSPVISSTKVIVTNNDETSSRALSTIPSTSTSTSTSMSTKQLSPPMSAFKVLSPSLLITKIAHNNSTINQQARTTTFPPPPIPPAPMPSRRPSQIDRLVSILTRSRSITQQDLLLLRMDITH